MIFCPHCQMNYTGVELDNPNQCPKCEVEIREIKSQKLIDLMLELNKAVTELNKPTLQSNPKDIINIARIIEKGESRFLKEYAKRIEERKDLEFELVVISKFADRMGYKVEV